MFYYFARFWVRIYLKLFFRVSFTNEAPLPEKEAYIMAGKHISYLDPVMMACHSKKRMYHLAKSTLFEKNWGFTWLLNHLGALPVAFDTVSLSSMRSAVKVLKEGGILGVFPEGTRVHSNQKLTGGAGTLVLARMAKCPIVPFGIFTEEYRVKIFSKISVRIGKPVQLEELGVKHGTKEEYDRGMGLLLKEIKRLSEPDYEVASC